MNEPLVIVVNAVHILVFFIGWGVGGVLQTIANNWINERKDK